MSLIKTNAELRQFVTVSSGLEIATLAPHLTNAPAEQQIVKILGKTIYNDLLSAYNTNNLTPLQEILLPLVQKPLANLSVYNFIQQSGVIISSSGLTLATDRDKQSYQWQQIKLEQAIINTGYFALDALIDYLLENKAQFPTWEAESEYVQTRTNFINTSDDFQRWVNIKSNYRTLVALRPVTNQIESGIIKNTLGAEFYEHLKSQIINDTFTPEEENLVVNFIQPAVAHLVIARAIFDLNFDITADGAFLHSIKSNTVNIKQSEQPDVAQQETYSALHKDEGGQWLSKLTDFLNENASALIFPLYYNSDLFEDPEEESRRWRPDDDGGIFY